MASKRLYGVGDVAKLLGVSVAAVCNQRTRGSEKLPLPEPAFVHGKKNSPLWTRDQLDDALALKAAELQRILEEMEGTHEC